MRKGPRAGPALSGADALERALRAVAALAPELDDVELAEVLWLAAVRDRGGAQGRSASDVSQTPEPDDATIPFEDSVSSSQSPVTLQPENAPAQTVETPPPGRVSPRSNEFYENIAPRPQTTAIAGRPVAVPRGSVLPRSLELGRALRPFKRAWAPGPRRVLDVEATARDYARSGELLPVLKARRERWLDLALVVDRSASMAVWHEVAAEFAGVLRRLGAFKRVRLWDLTMAADGGPRLRPNGGSGSLPPTGPRNQILVLSDCSADGWYQDPIWRLLHSWGAAVPTALVNPLPARLWPTTALDLPAVRVASPGAAAARNTRLEYRRPWHLRLGPDADAPLTPLPVAVLTPYAIESWARVLMSAGTVGGTDLAGCDAVLVPAAGRFAEDDDDPDFPRSRPTGADLVDDFFANASTPAARLAVMCAPYMTLTMPLLHLVHQTMVPEATVAEVAEVVVSGLFSTDDDAGVGGGDGGGGATGIGSADAPLLRPREGVQQALEELLSADEAWQMYDMLSRYIAGHAGSLAELKAAIRDPAGAVGLPAELRPFAAATADTLRVLGALPPEDAAETIEGFGLAEPTTADGSGDEEPTPGDPAPEAIVAEPRTGLGKLIAFHANVDGIGTTTVAVNVAFILAANGKKVVFADRSTVPGRAEEVLRPMLSRRPRSNPEYELIEVDWAFPDGGSLDLLRWDVDPNLRPEDPRRSADELEGLLQLLLVGADYLIIDGSQPDSHLRHGAPTAPDAIVVCFPATNFGMAGAGAVYAERGLRVLPVPMGFHTSDLEPRTLDSMRAAFAGLPNIGDQQLRDSYWAQAGVSLSPRFSRNIPAIYVNDEIRPDLEALTSWITDGQVSSMPPVDQADRTRLLRRYNDAETTEQLGPMHIVYVGADRMWAEWARDVFHDVASVVTLHCVGVRPPPPPRPTDNWLFIESEAFRDSEQALAAAEAVTPIGFRVKAAHRIDVFTNRPRTSSFGLGVIPQINILLHDEAASRNALLLSFGAGPLEPGAFASEAPRPRRTPAFSTIRPRNPIFTGRDALLEEIRDHLLSFPGAVVVLMGPAGAGKTQVALEYAHRFSADYDAVRWIHGGRDTRPPTNRFLRELFVYDDADAIPDLRSPAPENTHIIVTTSSDAWFHGERVFEVEGLAREESIRLLRRLDPALSAEEADRIAELLGDRPAMLTASGTWLAETGTSADDYAELLQQQEVDTLSAALLASGANPTRTMWDGALQVLRREAPGAVCLLELAAFMADDIPLEFMRTSTAMAVLRQVDHPPDEPVQVLPLIDELSRKSLIAREGDTFHVRPLFQAFLKDGMSDATQRRIRHVVHSILAELRPNPADVDDPANWPFYRSIWAHLQASEALDSDLQETRWLFLDWLRLLQSQREPTGSVVETVTRRWLDRCKAFELQDPERLSLIADVLRARAIHAGSLRNEGRFQEAIDIDLEVLDEETRLFGREDVATLQTELGLAADYRALGQWKQARSASTSAYASFERVLRENSPRTLDAAADLAVTNRLLGNYRYAHSLDTVTLERRQRVLGPRHPLTLSSLASLARCDRLLGEYSTSVDRLREAWTGLRELTGESGPQTLRAATSLAVSLRLLGQIGEARTITEQSLAHYKARFALDHPDALVCRLNRAADASATGDQVLAVSYAEHVLEDVLRVFRDGHPFTGVCRTNLAAYLHRAYRGGTHGPAERAYGHLLELLGPEHPYTLVAAANTVRSDLPQFDLRQAAHREWQTHRSLQRSLRDNHPYTLAVGSNMAITEQALSGRSEEVESMRRLAVRQLTSVLGEEHPFTVRANQGLRIELELEMEPF